MSEELERRWDDAVEDAWRGFRRRLADRLAAMAEDEVLVVEVDEESEDGAVPYCQVLAGPHVLRVETVSNLYLAEKYELDSAQCGAVEALGFAAPDQVGPDEVGRTNFWADLEQREADRAAVMVVRTFREVHGIVHPVYLAADGLELATAAAVLPEPDPDPDQPLHPTSPDEVRAGVDVAVTGLYDEVPEWDEDGDLPLHTQHGFVWLVVSGAAPRILLTSPLVDDVVDQSRALLEVNLLNQREYGLSFVLRDGRISVSRELDVRVLVPAQLRLEVERLTNQVDTWAADLVARVGGRCMDETTPRPPLGSEREQPGASRFEAAFDVLVELERAERGSVGPATMARVFQQDTGLLIKAIRVTEGRLRDWKRREQKAEAAGNDRLIRFAQVRQKQQRELRSRMRSALRLLVDAPVRKVQLDQLALIDEDECGTTGS